ncbi:MAG: 5'-methylthioadenosine/S-adenosylhomocysteine nucleosidase [Bacillales bacterium]
MEKIGVLVAVNKEFEAFINSFSDYEILNYKNIKVYVLKLKEKKIYFVKSGYGIIDSSAMTQFLISVLNVEVVLNYGVVGALEESLKVNDLLIVKDVIHYDYDVSEIDNILKHQYIEFDNQYMPTSNKLILKALNINPNLKLVRCASGDKFISSLEFKNYLHNEFSASICDMESASIVRICFKNNIPCFLVKCISDTLNGDGKDYLINVKKSSEVAFDFLIKFIETL